MASVASSSSLGRCRDVDASIQAARSRNFPASLPRFRCLRLMQAIKAPIVRSWQPGAVTRHFGKVSVRPCAGLGFKCFARGPWATSYLVAFAPSRKTKNWPLGGSLATQIGRDPADGPRGDECLGYLCAAQHADQLELLLCVSSWLVSTQGTHRLQLLGPSDLHRLLAGGLLCCSSGPSACECMARPTLTSTCTSRDPEGLACKLQALDRGL